MTRYSELLEYVGSVHFWRFKRYLELIKGKIGRNDRVLDIGCGEGTLLSCLPKGEKFGIDVDKELLQVAEKRCPRARFFLASAEEKLPFEDNFFDWVICTEVIEHIGKPECCLQETRRVLKKRGYFLVSTYNHYNIFNLLTGRAFSEQPVLMSDSHIREYNWYSFRKLVRKYFEIVQQARAGGSKFFDYLFQVTGLPVGEFMIILAKKI